MATAFFEETGRQVEVIEVKGSVELAPLAGLSDGIVDLVDTGRTMRENGLEVREEIAVCTARLVANRVAHKLRASEVDDARPALARGAPRREGLAPQVGRLRSARRSRPSCEQRRCAGGAEPKPSPRSSRTFALEATRRCSS